MACSKDSVGYMHHLSEIRIVLLGCRAAGKSSSGNTILGREEFDSRGSSQCVMRQGEVAGRKITVVEAPGWKRDTAVKELLKEEIELSVSMCPPGPHAVLLVIRLDFRVTKKERRDLIWLVNLLGRAVWSHTIVLFTFGDSLGDTTIERHIESEGKSLQALFEKCGDRYHVFNNNERDDKTQVTELMEKIEEMVAGNRGSHFEMDRTILQKMEERKKSEEERSKERRMKVTKKRDEIRKNTCIPHLSEVRIVLLGYRNAGKSSSVNTILGGDGCKFIRRKGCVIRQGLVKDRNITLVEAPGWPRNCKSDITQCCFDLHENDILLSVSMCPPGPHAVLLVIGLDLKFREKDRKKIIRFVNLLGPTVWSHTIVLFTFGDFLGDTTIERHIKSEGKALQWLIEKCGDRYHVFNNNERDDKTQVTELMEKIEEMVVENKGRVLNTDTWASPDPQDLLKKRNKRRLLASGNFSKPFPDRDHHPGKITLHGQTCCLGPVYLNRIRNSAMSRIPESSFQTHSIAPVSGLMSDFDQIGLDYKSRFKFSDSDVQGPWGIAVRNPDLYLPCTLSDDGTSHSEDQRDPGAVHEVTRALRTLHLPAGQFKCKFSDLVFDMKEESRVMYRIVSWDSRVLDGLCDMEPAGPLYSIECHEGSIHRLHLPHCETRTDEVQLSVAHVTGGNVEILQPLKVTNSHVIVEIQHLSRFGLLKAFQLLAYPIRAQVLLFYEETLKKLHIHLLKRNIPVEEVQKRHKDIRYIPTSSRCKLTPGKNYRPSCKTTDSEYVSQPEDETFDRSRDPNHHPTFEVFLKPEVNKVTLSLLDENGLVVWKPRDVVLTGTKKSTTSTDSPSADFVDKYAATLIQKVPSVMEIVDHFRDMGLSYEMYSKINAEATTQEQMREFYNYLNSAGRAAKVKFYQILLKNHLGLITELETGSGLD